MKKFPILILLLALLNMPSWAKLNSPLAYLNAMTDAQHSLNFEQIYQFQQGETRTSFRYRHANVNGKEYAQQLKLDLNREELIQRGDMVSYFGEFQPFSLKVPYILDNLPSVVYTDFRQLTGYNFVDAGRSRIADRIARIIRIIPRDDFRYQYQLWIDEDNYLLLRSDLLDRDNNVLEQFNVLQSLIDEQFLYIVEPINTLILPAVIQREEQASTNRLEWKVKWLPSGFREQSSTRQPLLDAQLGEELIESRHYSDGLFAFTIYIVQNQGVPFHEQFWRDGKTSVYSQTLGDKDVVIVGDIPLTSARHIVQEIELGEKKE